MTDVVSVIKDSSLETYEIIEVASDVVVVVEDTGADNVQITENTSPPLVVIDNTAGGSIDGFPAIISNPQNGDVISYIGGAFINRPQIELTDGGNF